VMYFPDAATVPAFVQPTQWLQWNAGVVILTTTLPGATHGVPYTATLNAQSGTSPVTWSLSAGTLPVGLALSAAGGISGTPTTAGTSNFTVAATTAQAAALGTVTATQALSIVVA
jgi:large repetitive protein